MITLFLFPLKNSEAEVLTHREEESPVARLRVTLIFILFESLFVECKDPISFTDIIIDVFALYSG